MRLLITRHGETIENKAGILQGHTEGTLSGLGIEQAEKLAARLKNENIDIIFSSDLGRAASTARIIAEHHPGIPLIFSRDLRERHLGEFQGKTKQQCGWDSRNSNNKYPEPENGEKTADVYLRAERFYNHLLAEHSNNNILLVAHGFIGKVLIAVIMGKTISDIVAVESLRNTSLSMFEIDSKNNYSILTLDSIDHLEC